MGGSSRWCAVAIGVVVAAFGGHGVVVVSWGCAVRLGRASVFGRYHPVVKVVWENYPGFVPATELA